MKVERHASLPSTNDRAHELARAGKEAGWVVVADGQSAGRGQRGAHWHSPPGDGLYVSFLLRPNLVPERVPPVTLAAGIAVYDAISAHIPGGIGLKWPNDILMARGEFRGAKAGGILVESAGDMRGIHYVVVGIGINLSGHPERFNPRARALTQYGVELTRDSLMLEIKNNLITQVEKLERLGSEHLTELWNERALGLGEAVDVWEDGNLTEASALEGLNGSGGLQLRYPDQSVRTMVHGRIRLQAERDWLPFPP